jgi:hypothetical protein
MSWKDKGRPLGYDYWGGKHYSGYGFYRAPKTTQERRKWDDEYGRTRRSRQRLVNAWDDMIRCVQRSWKVHRKTQYKPIE